MKTMAILALAATTGAAAAQDIGGRYAVTGTGLDGSRYDGVAEITASSDVTCEIVWNTGGQISRGICMRQGDVFAASYVVGKAVGMVIYRVSRDGAMAGTWTVQGANGVGTETLSPAGG